MNKWLCVLFICIGVLLGEENVLDEMPYDESFEGVEVELLISYKIISKNNLIEGESYKVSHAMNYKSHKYKVLGECEIDASGYNIMDDMPYFIMFILKREKEQVLECLFAHEVLVRENTNGRDNVLSSQVKLEIAPRRIKAKLVNKSIVMYILSKEAA